MWAAAAFRLLLICLVASVGHSQIDDVVIDDVVIDDVVTDMFPSQGPVAANDEFLESVIDATQQSNASVSVPVSELVPPTPAPLKPTASPSVEQVIPPTHASAPALRITLPPTPVPFVSSLSSPVAQPLPTPIPAISVINQTDNFFTGLFPEFIEVGAVVTLAFTGNSTWNESDAEAVAMAIQSILEGASNFTGIPLSVAFFPGEPSGNTAGETTVQIGVQVSIPYLQMDNYLYIDGYQMQLFINEILSQYKSEFEVAVNSNLSQIGFEANGVKVSVVVDFTPPTSSPTYSPTTGEFYRQIKKERRVRSIIFVSIFWVIIIVCFSLENGLCAYRNWRKDEDKAQYGSVGLGHLD